MQGQSLQELNEFPNNMYFKIYYVKSLISSHLKFNNIPGKTPIHNVNNYSQTIEHRIEDAIIEVVYEGKYNFVNNVHTVIDEFTHLHIITLDK